MYVNIAMEDLYEVHLELICAADLPHNVNYWHLCLTITCLAF